MAAQDDEDHGPPPLSLRDSSFSGDRALRPWSWRLGIYLRALAGLELAKGLLHWALVIGAGGASVPLEHHAAGWFLVNVLFAIADPVAAVGLWVGARWGVAIWLIAALAQIVASALGNSGWSWLSIAAVLVAMSLYVGLSVKARGETV